MTEISPRDTMFTGDREHYRRAGISAVENVELALASARRPSPTSILDFGCGYGRVLRALKEAFPHASLAASDIDRDGVDFCASRFEATPYYSSRALDGIVIAQKFDVIWCGSVFTHLPLRAWRQLFTLFSQVLEPRRGVLIFTTHGRVVADRIRTGYFAYGLDDSQQRVVLDGFGSTGFGYSDYSGQKGYGIALSSPSYVCNEVSECEQFRIVLVREHGWNDHQDVIAAAHA